MAETVKVTRLNRTVLVLAVGTNGLGIVRGLHSKGIKCIVACKSRLDHSYLSRLPCQRYLLPTDEDIHLSLKGLIEKIGHAVDCVIPSSDEYASILRKLQRDSVENLRFILPPGDLVDLLNDKVSEVSLIEKTGTKIPRTLVDLSSFSSELATIEFPIIVKPRSYQGYSLLGAKNRIVENEEELSDFCHSYANCLNEFLAQEIIPGDESFLWVCNATFDADSNMVSAFTFQRLGTIPYMYGVTTFGVSRSNAMIKDMCAQLGASLRYTGPIMVEFKQDPRSGDYLYIEINPRLGMCNWFDTKCGVRNAYNTYALAVGLKPDINVNAQIDGVIFINLLLDIYARIRGGQDFRSILRLYRQRFSFPAVFPAMLWYDPLPVFSHPLSLIARRFFGRNQ